MKTDYKTLLEDTLSDISCSAEDISFGIEVDDVDVMYTSCNGGNSAEINFDVDSHVESIEGASISEWVIIAKSDLDYALTRLAERIENEQNVSESSWDTMIPLSVVEGVLDQYRILTKDSGDLLREKPIADVITEISDEVEKRS